MTDSASLPTTGYVRLNKFMQFVPLCRTTIYKKIKSGEFPKPVALGARAIGFKVEDVRALIEKLSAENQ
jgi:predicted DNA-binding transcriptional regulator AlpA